MPPFQATRSCVYRLLFVLTRMMKYSTQGTIRMNPRFTSQGCLMIDPIRPTPVHAAQENIIRLMFFISFFSSYLALYSADMVL